VIFELDIGERERGGLQVLRADVRNAVCRAHDLDAVRGTGLRAERRGEREDGQEGEGGWSHRGSQV
jgi:hypothetical protein